MSRVPTFDFGANPSAKAASIGRHRARMNLNELHKSVRFLSIYGLSRTLFKALGRKRLVVPLALRPFASPDIAIVGCGQFAFATIGYFITRRFGRRFRWCQDVDRQASESFARLLGVRAVAATRQDYILDSGTRIVYVASNHASHTEYAIEALRAGKDVYVEKPIAVSMEQLALLVKVQRESKGRIFAGYNRPFSGAIRYLRQQLGDGVNGGLTLQCFISGHMISADHWYRDPAEGTRVCGNAGHWIDLFVHILSWRGRVNEFRISITQADLSEPDDNFSLAIATDSGDLFSMVLSARGEPFEGINESVHFQQAGVICKIDDFRRLTLWDGARLVQKSFWPKDVGHGRAILQPFDGSNARDWDEVVISSILTLRIAEMVRDGTTNRSLKMSDELTGLNDIAQSGSSVRVRLQPSAAPAQDPAAPSARPASS